MPALANGLFQFANYAAFLLLAAIGLMIILGVLNIINLAHGELIMLGAYVATITYHLGVPLVLSVLASMVAMGIFGVILEVLIIRRFYANKVAAMVATWGLSLILSQGMLIWLGPSLPAIPIPNMTLTWAGYSYSGYRLILIAAAVAVIAAMWLVLYKSRLGTKVRATMQNPDIARSLGTDTGRIYMITFATGCALAGLTGGLYAPVSTIVPTMGEGFIAPAFITVVVGGGVNPIIGAIGSSSILSAVSTPMRMLLGELLGLVSLLLTSLILMRFLPNGVSGTFRNLRRRRIAHPRVRARSEAT